MTNTTETKRMKYIPEVAVALLFCGLVLGIVALPRETNAQSGCAAAEIATQIQSKIEALGEAKPGIPTIDAANLSVTAKLSTRQRVECVLNSLAIIAARTTLDSITQSTVNWINSGFDGSPAFVTDLQRNLRNLGDAVAEDFIRGLDQVVVNNTGISIRAPFQDQIARQLRAEFYRTTSSYGFDLRHPYQDCGSSRGFSWNTFLCESRDQNNPYGRYMIARNELFAQLDEAAQNRIAEIGWGNGFLPWRGNCGPTGNTRTTADLSTAEKTRNCPVRTPGTVIAGQLETTLGTGVRQLELADNFDAIISALATQLIGQVLGGGGLSGVSSTASSELRPLVDGNTSALGSQLFQKNIADAREQATTYRNEWARIFQAGSTVILRCGSNSSRGAEAGRAMDTADSKLRTLDQVLASLAQIEAERVRVTGSGASTQQSIEALTSQFRRQLDSLERTADGSEAGLYQRMTELAAECR